MPARERTQENAPPKYKGAHIPSKAFSYLQYLTQNETTVSSTNTNNNVNSFSNPSPASQINEPSNLEFASLQVFETPAESGNKKNNFKINANNNASFPNLNNDIIYQNRVEVSSDANVKNDAAGNDKIIESSLTVKTFETDINEDANLTGANNTSPENTHDFVTTSGNVAENESDDNFTNLPKSASFVETLPAKETDPCFNEPNIALSFSNNETINESVDFNDIKEASNNNIEASKTSENEFKAAPETELINTSSVFEKNEETTQNLVHGKINNHDLVENKSNKNENDNQVLTNAQEIETSEF